MDSLPLPELLNRARSGDEDALVILLQRYRPQLQALAQRQLESAVKTRLSPSDVSSYAQENTSTGKKPTASTIHC